LPVPATNVVVAGVVVDAYWPAEGLVVELDGYAYHRSRAAFERDHEATERLQRAGLEVHRFTHRRVINEPAAVIETIRTAFSAREARDKLNPCPMQGRR
jgi:very-short-patch-repair endonuclease